MFHKLKALFFKSKQQISLDLIAAEIKCGRAYLHPRGNRETTYLIRSDDIEIILNRDKELSDNDIVVVKKKEKTAQKEQDTTKERRSSDSNRKTATGWEQYEKRKFTVTLYAHEYDALMNTIKEYGYKRAEFIIASANTATRGTMDRERKKIVLQHKQMRKEERTAKEQQRTN